MRTRAWRFAACKNAAAARWTRLVESVGRDGSSQVKVIRGGAGTRVLPASGWEVPFPSSFGWSRASFPLSSWEGEIAGSDFVEAEASEASNEKVSRSNKLIGCITVSSV